MTQRNVRRSADEWQAIVDQYTDSGLKVNDFCQQQGYALATFSKWKRRLSPPQSDRANKSFAPVVTTTTASPPERSSVTLQIGRAVTLSIRVGGVDGEL